MGRERGRNMKPGRDGGWEWRPRREKKQKIEEKKAQKKKKRRKKNKKKRKKKKNTISSPRRGRIRDSPSTSPTGRERKKISTAKPPKTTRE